MGFDFHCFLFLWEHFCSVEGNGVIMMGTWWQWGAAYRKPVQWRWKDNWTLGFDLWFPDIEKIMGQGQWHRASVQALLEGREGNERERCQNEQSDDERARPWWFQNLAKQREREIKRDDIDHKNWDCPTLPWRTLCGGVRGDHAADMCSNCFLERNSWRARAMRWCDLVMMKILLHCWWFLQLLPSWTRENPRLPWSSYLFRNEAGWGWLDGKAQPCPSHVTICSKGAGAGRPVTKLPLNLYFQSPDTEPYRSLNHWPLGVSTRWSCIVLVLPKTFDTIARIRASPTSSAIRDFSAARHCGTAALRLCWWFVGTSDANGRGRGTKASRRRRIGIVSALVGGQIAASSQLASSRTTMPCFGGPVLSWQKMGFSGQWWQQRTFPHTHSKLTGQPDPGTSRDWSRGHRELNLIGTSRPLWWPCHPCSLLFCPCRTLACPCSPCSWRPGVPRRRAQSWTVSFRVVVDHPPQDPRMMARASIGPSMAWHPWRASLRSHWASPRWNPTAAPREQSLSFTCRDVGWCCCWNRIRSRDLDYRNGDGQIAGSGQAAGRGGRQPGAQDHLTRPSDRVQFEMSGSNRVKCTTQEGWKRRMGVFKFSPYAVR